MSFETKQSSVYVKSRRSPANTYTVPSKESYFLERCNKPLEEICLATNYFQLISSDFKVAMLKFVCEHSLKGPSVYGEYAAPSDHETLNYINGKGGYFLKKTAEDANIYLIWHHRQKNIYKFWGATERGVRDAMNRLRGRIVKYVIHVKPEPIQRLRQEPDFYKLNEYKLNESNIAFFCSSVLSAPSLKLMI